MYREEVGGGVFLHLHIVGTECYANPWVADLSCIGRTDRQTVVHINDVWMKQLTFISLFFLLVLISIFFFFFLGFWKGGMFLLTVELKIRKAWKTEEEQEEAVWDRIIKCDVTANFSCGFTPLVCSQIFHWLPTYSALGIWWHTVTHGRGSEGERCEWSG